MNTNNIGININQWEDSFYKSYNDAYRSFLNSLPPTIFMHNLLERIIKTTGCSTGYIVSLNIVEDEIVPNIEAFYKDKLYDDTSLFHNLHINLDQDSICIKSSLTENIHLINDLDDIDACNEPIQPPDYCKSYMCIPYKFNDKIIGVLGLFRENQFPPECENLFKILGNLIANLQNNYFKVKLSSGYSDKKVVTYQLLEDILNTVHDGILIVDGKFDIIHKNMYANQLFTDLYGDMLNTDQTNLLKIFPQLQEIDTKKIFKNRKVDVIVENNSSKRQFEFMFNTVICGGFFYHLVTIHSVQINNSKGMNNKCLIAFLSHELRNPLQSITLANHLIKSGLNQDIQLPKKFISYFEIINKSCQDMKKIINDILDLSRIESNEFVIDMDIHEVEDLINTIIEDNLNEATTKGLAIEKCIDESVPSTIYTDSTRITQILNNLVTNAIKYSNSGTITIKVLTVNNDIKFSVVDQGIGIKTDEMNNLFKTYGQTSNSRTNMNSQGLGLCVSQKIANLLGGKITVRSEHLKGSTFSFYHPITLGLSRNKYENNDSIGNLQGNVLLVDDNTSNLTLLHTLLEQFNYEYVWNIKIETVTSGEQAIELCSINNYDLIFMDINMPKIDGVTTTKIIKNNEFGGKIVAMTGNILSREENKGICKKDSYECFDDIIIKPFDDQTVMKTLHTFL